MPEGFTVAADQLREHARNVEAVQDRFRAVKSASAQIVANDEAYGFLCQWIAGILASRHTNQDELYAYVEENLSLVAQALRRQADAYDETDRNAAELIGRAYRSLGDHG